MLFDSHTHINNENYTDEQRAALIAEIAASDVSYAMDIGFDLASSVQAVKDAQENDWCYAVVGFHPHDAKNMDDMTLELIGGLAKKDKVKAIGEIGLDYYYDHSERDVQQFWFRRQIQLANQLKMPIVIHTREADQDTMAILKEEGAFSAERQSWFPKRRGPEGKELADSRVLLHCFSSSKELANQYVKLGATLSICGQDERSSGDDSNGIFTGGNRRALSDAGAFPRQTEQIALCGVYDPQSGGDQRHHL